MNFSASTLPAHGNGSPEWILEICLSSLEVGDGSKVIDASVSKNCSNCKEHYSVLIHGDIST